VDEEKRMGKAMWKCRRMNRKGRAWGKS